MIKKPPAEERKALSLQHHTSPGRIRESGNPGIRAGHTLNTTTNWTRRTLQKMIETERHPFEPFLPENAKVLFLGSFPPQPKRWSMVFYYPNWINDFWRITGLVFYGDRDRFCIPQEKRFDMEKIIGFCNEKGLAFYDTATEIRRLKDNASDKFLEVVTPTDIPALLEQIPDCRAIVTTGEKATDTLADTYSCERPAVNSWTEIIISGRKLEFWRLPSTSRAYPLPLPRKADAYRHLFEDLGMV